MKSWPEHDAEVRKEITRWKHKVMDAYWHAAPEKRKAKAIESYFRARYQRGMVYPMLALIAAIGVVDDLSWLILLGRFDLSFYRLWTLLASRLFAWVAVVMTERFVTFRWPLSRLQIHDVWFQVGWDWDVRFPPYKSIGMQKLSRPTYP